MGADPPCQFPANWHDLRQAALDPNLDTWTAQVLANSTMGSIRQAVALNPKVSPATLERLAQDSEFQVRVAAAANPQLPVRAMDQLKQDMWAVQNGLAKNEAAPPDLLRELCDLRGDRLQEAVAANPSAPPDLLQRLASSGKPGIQQAVVANPSTPQPLLWRMSKYSSPIIRQKIAKRPDAPLDLLRSLFRDPDTEAGARITIAQKADLSATTVAWLFEMEQQPGRKHPQVLRAIAAHPQAPTAILSALSTTPDPTVNFIAVRRLAEQHSE